MSRRTVNFTIAENGLAQLDQEVRELGIERSRAVRSAIKLWLDTPREHRPLDLEPPGSDGRTVHGKQARMEALVAAEVVRRLIDMGFMDPKDMPAGSRYGDPEYGSLMHGPSDGPTSEEPETPSPWYQPGPEVGDPEEPTPLPAADTDPLGSGLSAAATEEELEAAYEAWAAEIEAAS